MDYNHTTDMIITGITAQIINDGTNTCIQTAGYKGFLSEQQFLREQQAKTEKLAVIKKY